MLFCCVKAYVGIKVYTYTACVELERGKAAAIPDWIPMVLQVIQD